MGSRLAMVLVCLVAAGCSADKDPGPTYSTLGLAGEMLCGFVPKADVVAAVGTTALTTRGDLEGRGGSAPLQDANCFIRNGDDKVFEAVVWGRGMDNAHTEWLLRNLEPDQVAFPAEHPIGVANPAYQNSVKGISGAVATAVIGDWYINLRIYEPGKGRNAVTDASNLVQRVIATLQLPNQTTRTYTQFTPSTPTPPS